MRIVILALAVLAFLAVLWGPVIWLANRYLAQGVYGQYGLLRKLLPGQLVAAIVLTVAADFTDRWDLGTVIGAVTLAVSAGGAAILSLRRLMPRR
ncbi:hypothetical protein GJ700_21340 [Duganella sp. FT92W]|uniref:Uncharacterized protein n=1 Tax=Pseudoduganella rivuli TaxID=2666085 RepID=A0A7X2IQW6_9BURK|nr:hypothetical protein [Pseudoduganella rivuli]MRV74255.1 hypothetical protein [Pseudoduganella rivuli]